MELSLQQTQKLAPQVLQYLELLQMNTQELQTYLNNLSQENPTIELDEPGAPVEFHQKAQHQLEWLESTDRQNSYYHRQDQGGYDPLANLSQENPWEGLESYLLSQLEPMSQELTQAATLIIQNINSDGWLDTSLELLAEETGYSMDSLRQALAVVQRLEPAGVGARSLEECLLLQLTANGEDDRLSCEIVRHYLHALGKNHYGFIAQATGASAEEVYAACSRIRQLNPRPGMGFDGGKEIHYIVPDILVAKFSDHFEVVLNDRYLPHITISSYYASLLNNTDDAEVKEYLSGKIRQAQWVIRAVEQRSSTLAACTQVILELQQAFFQKGEGHLVPMTLENVASRLEIHESTVSRAIKGKYIQCAGGVYRLSSFFSRGLGRSPTDNDKTSPEAARALLRSLIDSEDPAHPKSDQQLCEEMAAHGCHLSRRTVAKYREGIGIASSTGRRRR